jgi:hypothetical protein
VVTARFSRSVTGLHCLLVVALSACPQTNPTPALISISPGTATREGPAFTLTVNGSNFVSGSSIQWNGYIRTTTFVSSAQLTAQIFTADILVAQTYNVTVGNPNPGGGTSNSLPFDVPCVLANQGPASAQKHGRIGAIYFDGWSGALTNFQFNGMVNGPYRGREPLSGWQDSNQCAIEQQLVWAHSFGLSFFVFDWYFKATAGDTTENLNSALQVTYGLADRHGMQFGILYVNHDVFIVKPSDWTTAVGEWMAYMTDPDYIRVSGKPLFVVYDSGQMRQTFGSSAATAAALDELRSAAQANGLPGVYIVGDFFVGAGALDTDGEFPDLSFALEDGYDAVSMYGNGGELPLSISGMQPFSVLADVANWIWDEGGVKSPVSFIPLVSDGYDPRPASADHDPNRPIYWVSHSPQEFASLVLDGITWAESNPRVRPEPPPTPPIILISCWNELSNGAYLVPTLDDGTSYGDSLAAVLASPPTQVHSILTLAATKIDAGPPYLAFGTLFDELGNPISGEVSVTVQALDGPGTVERYSASSVVPPGAVTAYVVAEANRDNLGPGEAVVTLYEADFQQPGDTSSRIPNGDFSAGAASWSFLGPVKYVVAEDGGTAIRLAADAGEQAWTGSLQYSVSADAGFSSGFVARVAPISAGNGQWLVAFFGASNNFVAGTTIPFASGHVFAGIATTDAGAFSIGLDSFGSASLEIEATYDGGSVYWPAYARVRR